MSKEIEIFEKVNDLFMKYGIKSVSMDDIARALGISKKTLYLFVDNKADLINKSIELHLLKEKQDIEEITSISKDPIDEMLNIARHIVKMLRQVNPSTMYDLQKYYKPSWDLMQSLHQIHIYDVIKNNIQTGIEIGLYRENLQPDIIAKFYVGKSLILVDEDIFPMSDYNREKLFTEFINYHIHGIASKKGLDLLEKHLKEKVDA